MELKELDAFFGKCDRTTMTQDDIDNGRSICVVGVAPAKPAEFVVFRIVQFTRSATLEDSGEGGEHDCNHKLVAAAKIVLEQADRLGR